MQIDASEGTDVRGAALDQSAQSTRRVLAAQLGTGLVSAGQELHLVGHILGPGRVDGSSPSGSGDDGLVELGYISQASGELVKGAIGMLEGCNLYSAAALIRQLVEMEYLTWSFLERSDLWGGWLRSTREERAQGWQPRHLRKAANGLFDADEYSKHCEIGGHPTPTGVRALLGISVDSDLMGELLWTEACTHGARIWHGVLAAAKAHNLVLQNLPDELDDALEQWRSVDLLPGGIGHVRQ